jgi:hypothetical protein
MDRKKLIVQPPVASSSRRPETIDGGVEDETPRRPAATPPLTVPPPKQRKPRKKQPSGTEKRKRKQMAEFRENAEKILRYHEGTEAWAASTREKWAERSARDNLKSRDHGPRKWEDYDASKRYRSRR